MGYCSDEQLAHIGGPELSSLLRGLDQITELIPYWERPKVTLPNLSRVTEDREHILSALCKLARAMDTATRKHVAALDYGWSKDAHLDALNRLLETETCLLPDMINEPTEVVSLGSFDPAARGFASCMAISLANAVQGRDQRDWMTHSAGEFIHDYHRLPSKPRKAIFAGLRYLFQTDPGFCLSVSLYYDPQNDTVTLLPLDLGPLKNQNS